MSGYCKDCGNQHCICDDMKICFKIGDKVKIVLLELNAFITAICIRENNYITYEISYFSNGSYSQIWVENFEIMKLV